MLGHPSGASTSLQPGFESHALFSTLLVGGTGSSSRAFSTAPRTAVTWGYRDLIEDLTGQQHRGAHDSPVSPYFSGLRTGRPAPVWSYRPSPFPHNLVSRLGGCVGAQAGQPTMLTAASLFQGLLLSAFGGLDLSLTKAGVWGASPAHPLLAVPTLQPFSGALPLGRLDSFLAAIVEQWVLGGAMQKEPYTAMPEDVRAIKRLRASKAVHLPCDTPLHIICGSKDVIHS